MSLEEEYKKEGWESLKNHFSPEQIKKIEEFLSKTKDYMKGMSKNDIIREYLALCLNYKILQSHVRQKGSKNASMDTSSKVSGQGGTGSSVEGSASSQESS